ncbi:hypothetical protein K2Y11_01230 [bacterium]|nr:hypothetical protein [bacterium]
MNKRISALLTSSLLMWAISPQAFGQGSSRPAPPKLTAEQQASASVSVNPATISKYLVAPPATAVSGKDVVALIEKNEVLDGQPSNASDFDGQTYLFADGANKEKFAAKPALFAPALGGFSMVAYKDSGLLVPGIIDQRSVDKGRLYLFATAEEKAKFDADPKAYQDADLILEGYSPVALVEGETLRAGDPSIETIFEGRRIRFTSELEKEAFLSDPARYYPTLGGLDVAALASGKAEFGKPKFAVIYKNRLYSFANDADRTKFVAQAASHSDLDVAADGNDPVLTKEGHPGQKGHYGISALFRGYRFLFTNEANRVKFIKDPSKYFEVKEPAAEVVNPVPPASSTEPPKSPVPAPPSSPKTATAPAPPKSDDADPNVIEPARNPDRREK